VELLKLLVPSEGRLDHRRQTQKMEQENCRIYDRSPLKSSATVVLRTQPQVAIGSPIREKLAEWLEAKPEPISEE
jgi:hypothetical protein